MPRTLLFALLLTLAAHSHAATIEGVVAEQGSPIAAAEVYLVNADTSQIIKTVYSAADGSFRFTVTPGTYNVGARKAGYIAVWNKGIRIDDRDIDLAIELVDQAFADAPSPASNDDCE